MEAPGVAAGGEALNKAFERVENSASPRRIQDRPDLWAELAAAADRVHGRHLGLLAKAGVPRRALFDFERGIGGRFGLHPITTFRDGTFELAVAGDNAVVVGADLLDDGVEDLIAWYPTRPDKWWRRLGFARLLNEHGVLRAMGCRKPLALWRSPFHWLRMGCEGVTVLDWPLALPLLRGVSEVVAEDVDHGREVERRLRERRGPRISVPDLEAA